MVGTRLPERKYSHGETDWDSDMVVELLVLVDEEDDDRYLFVLIA